ncbi:hypothetical protein IKG29_02990 [Candidatus Saccharibacteria bacterium]|nr:hypothetical protein [Candidatus Saccharibacteria bacterium]
MNIYISGISGTGMGPLALMAKAAGFKVCGSDLMKGAIYDELVEAGIEVYIGEQDGVFLQEKLKEGVDWFCHTSALKEDHAELVLARESGIKVTKRDDLTAFLVEKLGLKMVAVAGTHGKTTTTAMIVWAALKLGLPVSYIVGTTLGFAPSGSYHEGDKYFVYEADEYDRNFLKYHPWLAVLPAVSYDHPDIYPTKEDYKKAFEQFKNQSEQVIEFSENFVKGDFKLAGEARRLDASLAAESVYRMLGDELNNQNEKGKLVDILNEFPGVGRRFEKISDGVYSDYAHHPEEIMATLDVAKDEVGLSGKKGVVVLYQPHQNTRQHEVKEGYRDAFSGADKIFWLPTYLTRENPDLLVIEPEEFIRGLSNAEVAEAAELNDELAEKLRECLAEGYLVLLMTAGPADEWLREKFGAGF